MGLEKTIKDCYDNYFGTGEIPQLREEVDALAKYAAQRLKDDTKNGMLLLSNIDTIDSLQYAILALSEPLVCEQVEAVLKDMGSSCFTGDVLVSALHNLNSREAALRTLKEYDLKKGVMKLLVNELSDPDVGGVVKNFLIDYGANFTVMYGLIGGLDHKNLREPIVEVISKLGQGRYVIEPLLHKISSHSRINESKKRAIIGIINEYDPYSTTIKYVEEANLKDRDLEEIFESFVQNVQDYSGFFRGSSSEREIAKKRLKKLDRNKITVPVVANALKDESLVPYQDDLAQIFIEYGNNQLTLDCIEDIMDNPIAQDAVVKIFGGWNATRESYDLILGALTERETQNVAARVLKGYGPRRSIVGKIIDALYDPVSQDVATKILAHYGPTNLVRGRLLGEMKDLSKIDAVCRVFMAMGPSEILVDEFTSGFYFKDCQFSLNILKAWGPNCLDLIQPEEGSELYDAKVNVKELF